MEATTVCSAITVTVNFFRQLINFTLINCHAFFYYLITGYTCHQSTQEISTDTEDGGSTFCNGLWSLHLLSLFEANKHSHQDQILEHHSH